MDKLSRRDVLKLGGAALSGLAFSPLFTSQPASDDAALVRVATKSLSVYREPTDKSTIVGTWYRDDLLRVYGEVKGIDGEPKTNPIWYRVWGGYLHRARLQKVKTLLNKPMDFIPEGTRQLVEVTVPFTQCYQSSKAFGWRPNIRLYYESVHWVTVVEPGPDGTPWYKVFDELTGTYHVSGAHVRPIRHTDLEPISPDVPNEQKRIEVNLTTQVLTAYEYDQAVFQTKIAAGIPAGRRNPKELSTKTPDGDFYIQEKMPSKHMGDGSLFAGTDDYELPGVPWTLFFTEVGHAFHGTYWHENYGTPMSRGCVNMRTAEARWLFRWARPPHTVQDLSTEYYFRGRGTAVNIHY